MRERGRHVGLHGAAPALGERHQRALAKPWLRVGHRVQAGHLCRCGIHLQVWHTVLVIVSELVISAGVVHSVQACSVLCWLGMLGRVVPRHTEFRGNRCLGTQHFVG